MKHLTASGHRLRLAVLTALFAILPAAIAIPQLREPFDRDTGYRGIWYSNQKVDTEYVYKYSGGLGTYCAKHIPIAICRPEVHKTFFVYGGTKLAERSLCAMVSYYDHKTGQVPRPTLLHDKGTSDAHDNPVLAIDDAGYLWVFVSAHGKSRPAFIYKSTRPYATDDFDLTLEANFSYPQPWYLPGKGFLFLHTSYDGGRMLYWQTSPDGVTWSDRSRLAGVDQGHYQVSWPCGDKVGTAFNYHPEAFVGDSSHRGLNWRTNLYYVESDDLGATWRSTGGGAIATPITSPIGPALVHDYQSEGRLVYLKDLNYDKQGRPIVLHVTASSWEPGPAGDPRRWRVAHWTGEEWALHTITRADNNYDTGCIHVEADGTWRVVGPTETGPQPYNPGGEIAVWCSTDQGKAWTKERQLTQNSLFNHSYVRRPLDADPGFDVLWADGHGRRPSESRLYFYDRSAQSVFRLPYTMDKDIATPELVE